MSEILCILPYFLKQRVSEMENVSFSCIRESNDLILIFFMIWQRMGLFSLPPWCSRVQLSSTVRVLTGVLVKHLVIILTILNFELGITRTFYGVWYSITGRAVKISPWVKGLKIIWESSFETSLLFYSTHEIIAGTNCCFLRCHLSSWT